MTHEVFVLMRAALKAKGVPFEILYGPPQVPLKVGDTRIEFFRDYATGDSLDAPRGVHRNPRMVRRRLVAVCVRIFARSTLTGARRHDHEDLADQLADMVTVALHDIAREQRIPLQIQRGGFAQDETTDGWAGVVYELRFKVERGVFDVTFKGAAATEAALTATSGRTDVALDGPGMPDGLPGATTTGVN